MLGRPLPGEGKPADPDEMAIPMVAGSFSALDGGSRSSCGIHTDGTLVCWDRRGNPWNPTVRPLQTLATGHAEHHCALAPDGTATCWGCPYPRDGWGDCESPCNPPDEAFRSVTVGPGFSCGLTLDRRVRCWGYTTLRDRGSRIMH